MRHRSKNSRRSGTRRFWASFWRKAWDQMADSTDRPVQQQIEEAQAALRRNIEQARELAEQTQRLLRNQGKATDEPH